MPEQDIAATIMQQYGMQGVVYLTVVFGGRAVWLWVIGTFWPQWRADRLAEAAARAKREEEWYSLIHRSIDTGEKILLIQSLAYPEHARSVLSTLQERD